MSASPQIGRLRLRSGPVSGEKDALYGLRSADVARRSKSLSLQWARRLTASLDGERFVADLMSGAGPRRLSFMSSRRAQAAVTMPDLFTIIYTRARCDASCIVPAR